MNVPVGHAAQVPGLPPPHPSRYVPPPQCAHDWQRASQAPGASMYVPLGQLWHEPALL